MNSRVTLRLAHGRDDASDPRALSLEGQIAERLAGCDRASRLEQRPLRVESLALVLAGHGGWPPGPAVAGWRVASRGCPGIADGALIHVARSVGGLRRG
jgi:hypothetical protein